MKIAISVYAVEQGVKSLKRQRSKSRVKLDYIFEKKSTKSCHSKLPKTPDENKEKLFLFVKDKI